MKDPRMDTVQCVGVPFIGTRKKSGLLVAIPSIAMPMPNTSERKVHKTERKMY